MILFGCIQVSVGRKPVTGLRLYLEGNKCNRLEIHLQHLSSLPQVFRPHWDRHVLIGAPIWKSPEEQDAQWFEPVQWKAFGHVCTAPIEYTESRVGDSNDAFIVTGAQLQVGTMSLWSSALIIWTFRLWKFYWFDVLFLWAEVPVDSKWLLCSTGLGLWDQECALPEAFIFSSSQLLHSQISVGQFAHHISKIGLAFTAWTHWQYRESTTGCTGNVHFHCWCCLWNDLVFWALGSWIRNNVQNRLTENLIEVNM